LNLRQILSNNRNSTFSSAVASSFSTTPSSTPAATAAAAGTCTGSVGSALSSLSKQSFESAAWWSKSGPQQPAVNRSWEALPEVWGGIRAVDESSLNRFYKVILNSVHKFKAALQCSVIQILAIAPTLIFSGKGSGGLMSVVMMIVC
jgi:hypothetical protein